VVTPDLSVAIGKVRLKNPVLTASGTFGYGLEFLPFLRLAQLGGIVTKGLSPRPRKGNPPERIVETPAGMLNAIGLQNVGVDAFLDEKLPALRGHDTAVVANVFGETEAEYVEVREKLDAATGVAAIELNVSCPNTEAGGTLFGNDAGSLARITRACRSRTRLPLLVKLSPNVTDIRETAKAAGGGRRRGLAREHVRRDGRGCRAAAPGAGERQRRPFGPAIRPLAVWMTWQVRRAVAIPIVAMGGIASARDAVSSSSPVLRPSRWGPRTSSRRAARRFVCWPSRLARRATSPRARLTALQPARGFGAGMTPRERIFVALDTPDAGRARGSRQRAAAWAGSGRPRSVHRAGPVDRGRVAVGRPHRFPRSQAARHSQHGGGAAARRTTRRVVSHGPCAGRGRDDAARSRPAPHAPAGVPPPVVLAV
jgi:dihydroorotate dehydrogenase (NAD+) catalytic subunit